MCTAAEKIWGPKRSQSQTSITSADECQKQASVDAHTESNSLVLSTSTTEMNPTLDFSIAQPHHISPSVTKIGTLTGRQSALLDNLYRRLTTADNSDLGHSILIVRKISWETEKHSQPVQMQYAWPQYSIESESFRYAALTFACRHHGIANNREMFEYRGNFLFYTQKALNEGLFVEAAVAIYANILDESAANDGLGEVMRHFTGLCMVLQKLKPADMSVQEFQLLKRIFKGALQALRVACWSSQDPENRISDEQLKDLISLCMTLQRTPLELLGSVNYHPLAAIDHEYTELINGLECYLLSYLDTYLAVLSSHSSATYASYTSSIDSIEMAMLNIIEILALLIPQNHAAARLLGWANHIHSNLQKPNSDASIVTQLVSTAHFEDIKAALLFAWIKVLQSLISGSPSRTSQSMAIAAARVLCGLCFAIADQDPRNTSLWWLPISRSLFWSGLLLTREVDSAGIDPTLQVSY